MDDKIMKNVKKYGFGLFTVVLIVIGFLIVINGVENGVDSANEYLSTSMDGSMDTDSFLIIQKGYILSNFIFGGILLLVGLSFFCMYLYKFFKEMDVGDEWKEVDSKIIVNDNIVTKLGVWKKGSLEEGDPWRYRGKLVFYSWIYEQ